MTTAAVAAPADAGLRALPSLLEKTEGWAELRAALLSGRSGTVDGAWGSSAALAAATLAAETPGTLLVVVPNPTDVEPWQEDIASFTGTRPVLFEAWESWPVAPNKGKLDPTTTSRLRLLQQLMSSAPKIVVCGVASVCQPVPERADLAARGRTISANEIVEPSELAEWLVTNGYKRVDAVEYPGEFSRRGGICDVFPPDAPDPYRFEFFGDEVESIRSFAAGSQRSLEKKNSVVLLGIEDNPSPTPPLNGEGLNTEKGSAPPSFLGKGLGRFCPKSPAGAHRGLPAARFVGRARRAARAEGAGQALLRARRDHGRAALAGTGVRAPDEAPQRGALRAPAA